MATKNVIADLVKGEKLNGDNYDVWHKKMKFMLNEQELEEHLTKEMVAPTEGQPLRDHTAYQKWNQKDRSARYTLLSSLQNDLIGQYDELPTCKALWDQLKFSFGGTSTTRLRSLVIKFEEYTKDPKHTMSEHLRMMSNIIGKLRDAGHALTDEQQVRAVIRSLPASWANMKQILTHSENIKNFSDVSQHVILEAETRDADKALTYVTQVGSRNANGKRKRQSKKGKKGEASTSVPKEGKMKKRKRGKRGGKKDLSKVKCFNCQQQGHFARATKHVACDREGFVDYHRIPVESKHIFTGNNSSEEVLGVGSYQLKLRTGRTLILEDVRYAPTVRLNLLSVTALLDSDLGYGLFRFRIIYVYKFELNQPDCTFFAKEVQNKVGSRGVHLGCNHVGISDYLYASKLVEENGKFTAEVKGAGACESAKAYFVESYAREHDLCLSSSLALGDCIADLCMLESVDVKVSSRSSWSTWLLAKHIPSDLRELIDATPDNLKPNVGMPSSSESGQQLNGIAASRGWPMITWKLKKEHSLVNYVAEANL
ncbi:hypothetical protein RJ640_023413 [Escallonia rubra]|uniref:Uncharacterized protein n=1 Tax=Escallonia rubra TaxID=112253 RepID=A0AA88R6S9_9ASTE|nr:hypothetical protein RJ640_023413 [Escallonia rubra]